jgi:hypothetical protein
MILPVRRSALRGGGRALCLLLVAALAIPSPAFAEKLKSFKLKTLEGARRRSLTCSAAKQRSSSSSFQPCPYCNAAFPKVQKLYDAYRAQGLAMVWINVVSDEQKADCGVAHAARVYRAGPPWQAIDAARVRRPDDAHALSSGCAR